MAIDVKADYVAEGLSLLREAHKDRPNLAALMSAFLGHAQVLENSLADLASGIQFENATGATLDGWGTVIGVDRNGLDDDSYKLFLIAGIAANHGNATLNIVVELAKKLFQTQSVFCKTAVSIRRTGAPTGAFIQLSIGSPKLPSRLWPIAERLLQQNIPGGVRLLTLATFNADSSFSFAGSPAQSQPGTGQGFASVADRTSGAPLASLIDRNVP